MRQIITLMFSIISIVMISAQDVHHTLNWMTPSNINTAKVGAVKNATYLAFLHRNQNFTIGPDFYQRNSFVVDHRGNSKFGFGLNLHYAQAGEVGTRTINSQALMSYHQPMGENTAISLGIKGGLGQFELYNRSDLRLGNDLLGIGTSEQLALNNPMSFLAGSGVLVTHKFNSFRGEVGFDTRYRWHPSIYESDYINDLKWLNKYFVSAEIPMKSYSINGSIFYQNMSAYYELQAQSYALIPIDRKRMQSLILGGGWRYGDAVQVLLGYQYKDIQVMMAYDHNISSLAAATRGVGALEIGCRYIIRRSPDDRSVALLNGVPMLDLDVLAPDYFSDKSRLPSKEISLTPSMTQDYNYTPWIDRDNSNVLPQFDPIYYDYDGIEVADKYRPILTKIKNYLMENPNAILRIDSYTDHKGPERYNQELAIYRANKIRDLLIDSGVSEERILAKGHGESNFVLDCVHKDCSDEDRRVNRRSILRIINAKDLD